MTPDAINACFELVGGLMLFLNCRRLYLDKHLAGVSVAPTAFFAVWGAWNVYFYSATGNVLSGAAGVLLLLVNLLWVGMAAYYRRRGIAARWLTVACLDDHRSNPTPEPETMAIMTGIDMAPLVVGVGRPGYVGEISLNTIEDVRGQAHPSLTRRSVGSLSAKQCRILKAKGWVPYGRCFVAMIAVPDGAERTP